MKLSFKRNKKKRPALKTLGRKRRSPTSNKKKSKKMKKKSRRNKIGRGKKKKEKEEIVPESKESSEARRILIEQIQKEASELSRSWNFQKTKKKNQSLNL